MKKKIIIVAGSLLLFVFFNACQSNDEVKGYYESGELKSSGKVNDGKQIGEWTYFYKSGQLKKTENYIIQELRIKDAITKQNVKLAISIKELTPLLI